MKKISKTRFTSALSSNDATQSDVNFIYNNVDETVCEEGDLEEIS